MSGTPRRLLVLLGLLVASSTPLHAQASLVILARHAEKAAPTGDPVLTAVGEARARALAKVFAGVRLDAVITTQFRRNQLTAGPVAEAQGLTPLVVPAGGDLRAHAAAIRSVLDSLPRGSAALVIGHSNTLGPILAALGGPVIPDLCDGEHATLLVLERGGPTPRLLRSRFGAAEPPEADQCQASR